jgi:hypothetical protein
MTVFDYLPVFFYKGIPIIILGTMVDEWGLEAKPMRALLLLLLFSLNKITHQTTRCCINDHWQNRFQGTFNLPHFFR